MLGALQIAVLAALLTLIVSGCAPPKYVPVCSEHGGIKSMKSTDSTDEWATKDAVCNDGTQQRPVLIDDGKGKWHLAVPSER